MFFLFLFLFLCYAVPCMLLVCFVASVVKLLMMDREQAKRYRQPEHVIRYAIMTGIAGVLSCPIVQSVFEELPGLTDMSIILLYGMFLYALPIALIVWFICVLKRFCKTDKTDTALRHRRKIWLIVASCITWVIVPAEVVLVHIPLISMPLM